MIQDGGKWYLAVDELRQQCARKQMHAPGGFGFSGMQWSPNDSLIACGVTSMAESDAEFSSSTLQLHIFARTRLQHLACAELPATACWGWMPGGQILFAVTANDYQLLLVSTAGEQTVLAELPELWSEPDFRAAPNFPPKIAAQASRCGGQILVLRMHYAASRLWVFEVSTGLQLACVSLPASNAGTYAHGLLPVGVHSCAFEYMDKSKGTMSYQYKIMLVSTDTLELRLQRLGRSPAFSPCGSLLALRGRLSILVLCVRTGSVMTAWDPFKEAPKASLRLGASSIAGEPLRWTQQGWQLQVAAMACKDHAGVVPECKIGCRHGRRQRVLLALDFG